MNQRKLSHALGPADVRMLSETPHAAERLGLSFTALVTIHFGLVVPPPADPGQYLRRELINRFGTWFRRRGIIWTALWVRENFVGQDREHVHLLVHVPRKAWRAFAAAAWRWWPQPGGCRRAPGLQCRARPSLPDEAALAAGSFRLPRSHPARESLPLHGRPPRAGTGSPLRHAHKPQEASPGREAATFEERSMTAVSAAGEPVKALTEAIALGARYGRAASGR